jgi:hypothetical protein
MRAGEPAKNSSPGECDPLLTLRSRINGGLDIVRDMKRLKTIGISSSQSLPTVEFWERYGNGEFNDERGGCCGRLSLPAYCSVA